MMRLSLLSLLLALLVCGAASQTAQVQWGYSLQCPPATLDYPCLISLTGTATINTTLVNATYSGVSGAYQYYPMVSFTGTRTFYNRFGAVVSTPVTSLAPVGEIGARNQLVLAAYALPAAIPTFRLGATVQFPGGLLGSEVRLIVTTGYATESIALQNNSNTNSENSNPATIEVCSTAPGFVASAYAPNSLTAAFYSTMAPCLAGPSFSTSSSNYTAVQTTPGIQQFAFTYTITDGVSFAAQVNATVTTDGTINYDSLGNLYYQLIAISGTRSEQSLLNASAVTTVQISSLMAPNIIATSNIAYITNNNRIYPQYPFLDRYGIAYTVTSTTGAVTQPELEDGSINTYTNTIGAYIYRLDTLDEQGLDGGFAYPSFDVNNTMQNSLSLTPLTVPAVYQLVQFCYVMYGLNGTLDYPWSVVVSGTGFINNTLISRTITSYNVTSPQPVYTLLGFTGTRTYTNRFGAQLVSALTLDQVGEDANVAVLSPISPYAVGNSVSFHLNGTIQTPGGLPATDLSFFLDPYPIEGTAYGVGIGTGTNALNNDPSKTVFISNMPGFVNSTYSNSNPTLIAGTVTGTTDLSQCKASFTTVSLPAGVTTPGIRAINLAYNITVSNGYNSQANLMVITDGSVNVDQLGNFYYVASAISGYRSYYNASGYLIENVTATAVSPLCSGPTVSNLDNVYCNNNRIYYQYPYVDRLGLAYQVTAPVPTEGSLTLSSNVVGVYVYRETVLEEAHSASNPAFTDSPNGNTISAVSMPSVATAYSNFTWGYIFYCTNTALEYPCAVSVTGTAIVSSSGTIQSSCGTGVYTALCNGTAYSLLGFTGTRTFTNRYGEQQIAYLSLQPVGEDYADNLLYTVSPYVDGDGPTFRLNGTDQALTEVIGGLMTNEINVFTNNNPVIITAEGIANSGSNPSALVYNASLTVICSTMPGFTATTYRASIGTASGSTNMAACLPNLRTVSRPTLTASVNATQYTLAYSVSDGITFTAQTIVTITTNGNAYVDALGNRYVLAVAANGTRTYYNFLTSPTTVTTASIIGVAPIGSILEYTSITGNRTTNRLYPFSAPYFDALGIGFNLSTPTFGTGGSTNISVFSIYQYKDATIEEYPTGGKYPTPAYQATAIVAGATANVTLPVTTPAVQPVSGYLCFIFYSLPGNVDYPWSAATTLNFLYNPTIVSRAQGSAVFLLSGSGSRTYTNRFGTSFTTPLALSGAGTDSADNYLYLGSTYPVDTAGLTWNLTAPTQIAGHGPSSLVSFINIYNSSTGVVYEQSSNRLDPLGQAYLSNVPGFVNVTIGASNINSLAPNYGSCTAPISFTNGLRPPTQPSVSNGALHVAYSYFLSDGATYSVLTNLTLIMNSPFGNSQDQLGNPYQIVVNITGTRLYTHFPTNATLLSTVTGLSTAAYSGVDQRFYPYSLLGAAPGVYTINTAPFLDYDGLGFTLSPSIPRLGNAPGVGTQYAATDVYLTTPVTTAYLTEGYVLSSVYTPNVNYQRQSYSFLP